jgi:hypothetical protein
METLLSSWVRQSSLHPRNSSTSMHKLWISAASSQQALPCMILSRYSRNGCVYMPVSSLFVPSIILHRSADDILVAPMRRPELLSRERKSIDTRFSIHGVQMACTVLNTADYCHNTATEVCDSGYLPSCCSVVSVVRGETEREDK